MKFLVLALVIAVAFFVWRSGRRDAMTPPKAGAQSPKPLQDMVACEHCGVHLPRLDAVKGQRGLYCGEDHLRASQDRPA